MKIMASGPIPSWQIDGETIETMWYSIIKFPSPTLTLLPPSYKANVHNPGQSSNKDAKLHHIHKVLFSVEGKVLIGWNVAIVGEGIILPVTDLGSKIIVDGDCNHDIKRRLLLGRKAKSNLDSVLKSTDISLLTEVILLVKVMILPVVMYRCESWTIKKGWVPKN